MLTIAGEARRQNGTHPNRSRKRSPVRQCGVPDSSRRAAACADSQNFTCARHVRNWLPYRLTFRFVVILRLRRREFDTGPRLHLTVPFPTVPIGLYACTGAARRDIDLASTHGKARSKPARAARSVPIWPGRARIVQRADRIRSRKCSPHAQHVDSSGCRRRPDTRATGCQWLPKTLTSTKKCGTATGTEMAPEKSHRNRRGIKNPNLFRYLCTDGIWLCIARNPRKASPFDGYPSYDNRMSPPENSHLCQKVAQQK